ncbi:MAG: metallophosphoesterase [Verrucomicrobia bacterium]|nr:metallophosphoesterase [Verrucomicrobiota bacterium]
MNQVGAVSVAAASAGKNADPTMRASILLHSLPLLAALSLAAGEPGNRPRREGAADRGGGRGEVRMPPPAARTEVPAEAWTLLLARPTDRSVTLSIRCAADRDGHLEFGPAGGGLPRRTPPRRFPAGEAIHLVLDGLNPGARHEYRFVSRDPSGAEAASPVHPFSTARPPGSPFVFTIQADSHLDQGVDPGAYRKSLEHAVAAGTDFHVDLGDTFMTDKYLRPGDARPHYLAQRHYLGIVGRVAPVFLVLGNHDGEQRGRGGSGLDPTTAWSNTMRRSLFPNPVPDAFYTGNGETVPGLGLIENYYAWEWGDALLIALDQYWTSARVRSAEENWGRTLGRAQYDWLRRVLAASRARYTFVFIHHLVGGETREGRGGAEAAPFFEWGGRDLEGRDRFAERRPGWDAPIHDLLRRRGGGVAVFHGHDHLYAHQERDGIVYQLVPQPGHSRFDQTRSAAEYGYKSGVIQGAAGILRISVGADRAVSEYVRSYPDSAENGTRRSGSVSHRWELAPRSAR